MLALLVAIAQFESNITSERMTDMAEYRRLRGDKLGGAFFGEAEKERDAFLAPGRQDEHLRPPSDRPAVDDHRRHRGPRSAAPRQLPHEAPPHEALDELSQWCDSCRRAKQARLLPATRLPRTGQGIPGRHRQQEGTGSSSCRPYPAPRRGSRPALPSLEFSRGVSRASRAPDSSWQRTVPGHLLRRQGGCRPAACLCQARIQPGAP